MGDLNDSTILLLENEKRFRMLVEASRDIIYTVNVDGYFTYVNPAGFKLSILNNEDISKKHFSELIREDYKDKILGLYKSVLNNKLISSHWKFPLSVDALAERWIEQSVTLLIEDDKIIGFQAIIRDVTEQMNDQEELLRAKNRAEESAMAKSQFLANMSHEIRTPMNGFVGLTNLLLSTKLTEQQIIYLKAMEISSDTLLVVINDILDISKIEAGKLSIQKKRFKLTDTVYSAVEILKNKAIEKNLRLEVTIDNTIPEVVRGDSVRLNQVLYNIIGNAVKFTENGTVKLNVKSKKQTESTLEVEFEVMDTGIGIPEDRLPHIFNAFTQAEGYTTRKYGGTGLGLTIVKKLIDLQKGYIHVTSEVGKGTIFTIGMTYEISSEKKTKEYMSRKKVYNSVAGLEGIKVLLVEDNPINQLVIRKLLSNEGMDVTVANNGEEGVNVLSENDFDVVLMDMQMPIMDGYQAMHHVRNEVNSGKREIPILALTAHVIEGEIKKCMKAGASGYLSKPFQPNDLFLKIKEMTMVKKHSLIIEELLRDKYS